MKTTSVVALCLAFACVSVVQGGRLERHLLQSPSPGINNAFVNGSVFCQVHNGACSARASVTSQAINDAVTSISDALATAIARAGNGSDVDASVFAFAQAIAQAYARIITSHVLSVYVDGEGQACAYTYSNAASFATAMSTAVVSAFAGAENFVAQAAGSCMARTVVSASVQAVQEANYDTCADDYEYNYIYRRLETEGYVQTIATAFSTVFVAIRDNNAQAAATCAAVGTSSTTTTTTVTSSGK
eukprot:g7701.t1